MLPPTHRQCYLEFKLALQELQTTATTTGWQPSVLRDHFQDVQQLFHSRIASLSADDLAPEDVSRWQSVQTEIYKQMRLLETDFMMLQASRSSATSSYRQTKVRDRIHTLIQYGEALLQL